MAMRGKTDNPFLLRIDRAKLINSIMGGIAVLPWEIDELPDEWIVPFEALLTDYSEARKSMVEIEGIKAAWRAKHKTYRKYRH